MRRIRLMSGAVSTLGLPAHAQAKLSCCHHRSTNQYRWGPDLAALGNEVVVGIDH
jgi:hypothetical protein